MANINNKRNISLDLSHVIGDYQRFVDIRNTTRLAVAGLASFGIGMMVVIEHPRTSFSLGIVALGCGGVIISSRDDYESATGMLRLLKQQRFQIALQRTSDNLNNPVVEIEEKPLSLLDFVPTEEEEQEPTPIQPEILDSSYVFSDVIQKTIDSVFNRSKASGKPFVLGLSEYNGYSSMPRDVRYSLVLVDDEINLTNQLTDRKVNNWLLNEFWKHLTGKYQIRQTDGRVTIEASPTEITIAIKKPEDMWSDPSLQKHDDTLGRLPKTELFGYLGLDIYDNKPILWEFEKVATSAHALIVGATGAGKTVVMRSIIESLVTRYSTDLIQIIVFDLKGTEFTSTITDLNHVYYDDKNLNVGDRDYKRGKYYTTDDKGHCVSEGFARVKELFMGRLQLFSDREVTSIYEWRKQYPNEPQPNYIIIIDEVQTVFTEKSVKAYEACREVVEIIAKKGRSIGFNLLATTQAAKDSELPKSVRENMNFRCTGLTPDPYQSKLVTGDEKLASQLTHNGDMYANVNQNLKRFISRFIEEGEFIARTQQLKRPLPSPSVQLEKEEIIESPKENPPISEISLLDKKRQLDRLYSLTNANNDVEEIKLDLEKEEKEELEVLEVDSTFLNLLKNQKLKHYVRGGELECPKCKTVGSWKVKDETVEKVIINCKNSSCRKQLSFRK